jgi:hypothetical protein
VLEYAVAAPSHPTLLLEFCLTGVNMAATDNRQQMINLIKSLSGQANLLVIPRLFIDLFGSLEAGLFVHQCVFWSDYYADGDGWFARTEAEIKQEISLSYYLVGKCVKASKGVIECKVAIVEHGTARVWRVNYDVLIKLLEQEFENSKTPLENFEYPSLKVLNTPLEKRKNSPSENQSLHLIKIKKDINAKKEKPAKSSRLISQSKSAAKKQCKEYPVGDWSWLRADLQPLGRAFLVTAGDAYWPSAGERSLWYKVLLEWQQFHAKPEAVVRAINKLRDDGMTISSPQSVTKTLRYVVAQNGKNALDERYPVYKAKT